MFFRRNVSLSFFLYIFCNIIYAQDTLKSFNEQDFFRSITSSYYTLKSTDLKNFTALVTNAKIEKFSQEKWQNSEIFPLQLIWFNTNKIYLSRQGVPSLDSAGIKDFNELVDGLKLQIQGILVDLQRFYLYGISESILQDYILQHTDQAVQITHTDSSGEDKAKVKHLFGINGQLLEIEVHFPAQNKRIYIFPYFKTVKSKWLCEGWKVQTFIKDEVQSGYILSLKNYFTQNIWVPIEIKIEVQTAEAKGIQYFDLIKLKNYLFNQQIELINTQR